MTTEDTTDRRKRLDGLRGTTALAKGSATVKLLHCPMARCHSGTESGKPLPSASVTGTASVSPFPTASGTPDDRPAFFVYTITIR
ncbi:hypothetical protein [Streptomyces sp. LaPpAH-108]|uniref:hypothetical protein n=1 Tax=Streptomyces sp. LaPpAH-108 TaxID=1155714 RepID=UPI00036E933C|nr:hypothetical protein [Streptomyces sp. LaPpAH-108]